MSWMAVGTTVVGAAGSLIGGSQPATSEQKRPQYLEDASKDVLSRGTALADRKYEAYDPRQRVAALGSNEQAGMLGAAQLQGKYQPMLDRASQQFSSGALSQYMNPYTKSVLDVNARRINEDFDAQKGAFNRKRGMIDAWGGTRATQLEQGMDAQRSRAMRDMETLGLSNAYDKGVDAFYKDRQAALDTANVGSNMDRGNISALMETGAVDRTQRQATQDFDYGQFLEKRDWSMNNFEAMLKSLNAASGTGGSTTTSTSEGGSVGGQIAGLASSVAGMYFANRTPTKVGSPTPTFPTQSPENYVNTFYGK